MHLKNLSIILLLFPTSSYASETFPNGSCEGPKAAAAGWEMTGCGYVADTGFYAHPDTNGFALDMSGKDLSGAKLKDVNFWDANLNQANLTAAELTAGNFYNADLQGANLSAATFKDANLWVANLTGANVEGTNFTGAFGNDNTTCPNGKSWGEAS